MSTYSPSLRIELITTGDQAGTWGNTTNTNLGTLIESSVAGYTSVSVTSANQAFTALNGAPDEARHMTIALTTTTSANFAVYAPPAEKTYVIYNASSYTATLYNSTVIGNTTAAGTGVAIPAGKTVTVWSDGTNFAFQNNHLSSLTLTTDLAVADGGTGASDAATARTNLGLGTMAVQNANAVAITGGSITGITDLAIADGGTGASTAAGARTNLGLGTMAVQDANSVAITGGSITGITDLAVADGGTGASTASGARTNLGLVIGTDVPSPTGTGASGTWGISISGNAATATNATNATNSTTQAFGTNNTTIATTAFVQAAVSPKAEQSITITAGTGLSGGGDLSANRTLAIANTGVSAGSYGSAAAVPVLAVNAQGQITSATTAAISLPVGAGSVSNGGSFTANTGPTGKCLIDVTVGTRAAYANYGTGTVSMIIGGVTVATATTATIEFSSRESGDHGRAVYVYTGSANSSVSVTVSYSGPGSFIEGRYTFIGT